MAESIEDTDLRIQKLFVAMEETTGKVNALTETVDGIIGDRAK